jgi:hypothetical protein
LEGLKQVKEQAKALLDNVKNQIDILKSQIADLPNLKAQKDQLKNSLIPQAESDLENAKN